ncbi:hypothetical protein K469DRAFT_555790 [Zopfia rhizophila CBS 207.26]|uniref:Uncharacterized protein n=1 Tax=Zopfia rhizophila CBS 207.26 TaxID=1314779 RepID=A0A6A6DSI6_9PEZI|nr:hypothetical protein K469DRAFT_266808 [Zopfia rhizophila CBS 207.26]KAF2191751.1 hypothetical protein K469DRAFT_555790 [Zopfia rhizophila CBS 207.26]
MNTPRKPRRNRRRSESPTSPTSAIREREEILKSIAEFAAEKERRSRMTPEEKTAENGLRLRRRLESEPALTVLLQPTPPGYMARARCRADYCSFAEEAGKLSIEIKDEYRIVLGTQPREYFHVSCLEKMLDLPSHAPTRFRLDTDCYRWNQDWPWTWGLMLRKWFEHGGCINLGPIAGYIKVHKRYEKEDGDYDTAWIEWHLAHQRKCNGDEEVCKCPPPPEAPAEPFLQDYQTKKSDVCPLSEVLRHGYVERLASAIQVDGLLNPGFSLVNPEREQER